LLEKRRKNRLFVLETGYNDFLMDYVGKSQNKVLMYNKENVSLSHSVGFAIISGRKIL